MGAQEAVVEGDLDQTIVEHLPGIVFRWVRHSDGSISLPLVSASAPAAIEDDCRCLLDQIHPGDRCRFQERVQEAARTLTPHTIDFRSIGRDGRMRWVRSVVRPQLRDGGAVVFDGISLDITGLKEREAALEAAEERLRDITLSGSDWIWEMDADLRFTYFSDRMEAVTGVPPARMLGRTRAEFYGAREDDPAWRKHDDDLRARRPFRDQVFHRTDADGRDRYFRVSGRPVFADGVFTGYRGVASEISAQVRVELQLRESEARFRDILEASSDWIWEMDAGLRFTCLSERFTELTGIPLDAVLGRTRNEIAAASNDPKVWREHLADLEARRPFKQFSYAYTDGSGRECFAMISGVPVFDDQGGFRGYRGTGTDITARVEAERRARRHEALLHQAVDVLQHGFALYDDQERLVLCNRPYYQMLGIDEPAPGTTFESVVHRVLALGLRAEHAHDGPDLASYCLDRHRRADQRPQEFSLANGRWITSSKCRLGNGWTVTVQVDITEIKHREQALKDSESRFRALAEAAFEGIVVHDGDQVIDVNRAFLEMTGHDADRVDEAGVLELLLTPGAGSTACDPVDEQPVELSLRKADGGTLPVEMRRKSVPLQDRPVQVVALRDISERKRAEAHIRHLAHHDALTGLPNRTLFRERLQHAMAESRTSGRRLALLQLDLDDFKDVNDTLGHHAGDVLLCEVAERLRLCVRDSDTVARLGGDEFAILLTNLNRGTDAAVMAQRIVDHLCLPVEYQGHTIHTGTSIGVTVYPDDDRHPEQLLKNADIALYRAKAQGRNTYSFFVSTMKVAAEQRRTLEGELRQAIERGQLELFYQPQIALDDGRVVGIEALLRWRDPERGLLSPGVFLKVAEETGLIVPIGRQALLEACRQARAWQDQGFEFGRIAVNLAPAQFKMGHLARTVRDVLVEAALEPERLELEITEGVFLGRGSDAVADTLRRLHRMNIRIALDDFGTGYASLAHLKQFPIDRLKIDQSFVRDIGQDPEDAAIVKTVVTLGRSLGLEVVAEGVETVEQKGFLRQHGCDVAQGFLFSRPLPAAGMSLFLEAMGDPQLEDELEPLRTVEPA